MSDALSTLGEQYGLILDWQRPIQPQIAEMRRLAKKAVWSVGELIYKWTEEEGAGQGWSWRTAILSEDALFVRQDRMVYRIRFGAEPLSDRTETVHTDFFPVHTWCPGPPGYLYGEVPKGIAMIPFGETPFTIYPETPFMIYPWKNQERGSSSNSPIWTTDGDGALIVDESEPHEVIKFVHIPVDVSGRCLQRERATILLPGNENWDQWAPCPGGGVCIVDPYDQEGLFYVPPGSGPAQERMELVCEYDEDRHDEFRPCREGVLIEEQSTRAHKVLYIRRGKEPQAERTCVVYVGKSGWEACSQGLLVRRDDKIRLFRF